MSAASGTAELAVLVTGDPWLSRAHPSAQRFVEAACKVQVPVKLVFFYQNAVLVAATNTVSRQPAKDMASRWLDLSSRFQIPLLVCQSAAMRRGIVSDAEAEIRRMPHGHWRDGFQESSLADLASFCARSGSKLIEFGG